MWTFLARRLLLTIPVLLGVSALVFSMLHMLPGDPVQTMIGFTNISPERVARMRHELGLDQPLAIQYVRYLLRMLHGDLGTSILNQQDVLRKIGEQLPSTIELAAAGMLVAIVVGFGLGVIAGAYPNSWVDSVATTLSLLFISTPSYLVAFVLILIFSLHLRWFPSVGTPGLDHLVLPSLALGLGYAAIITRMVRGGLINVSAMEYITAARGRGLSPLRILFRHMLRNAAIPVITILALQFGSMLSGAVVVEVIFGRQGIGNLLVTAILGRDYPVVQGIVLLIAVIYVIVNLIADVSYGVIDPRIHHQ